MPKQQAYVSTKEALRMEGFFVSLFYAGEMALEGFHKLLQRLLITEVLPVVVVVHPVILFGTPVLLVDILHLAAFAVFLCHLFTVGCGTATADRGEQRHEEYGEKYLFHVRKSPLTFNKIFAKLQVFLRSKKIILSPPRLQKTESLILRPFVKKKKYF